MKRIRILREPKGGKEFGGYLLNKCEGKQPRDRFAEFVFVEGSIIEVPDEIAELLCAARCPKCAAVYTNIVAGKAYCGNENHLNEPECDFVELVSGLAEEVGP